MSRSYCRPIVTDHSGCRKFYKRYANKIIRKATDVPDGRAYKKYMCSWNISDYHWYVDTSKDYFKEEFWKYTRK